MRPTVTSPISPYQSPKHSSTLFSSTSVPGATALKMPSGRGGWEAPLQYRAAKSAPCDHSSAQGVSQSVVMRAFQCLFAEPSPSWCKPSPTHAHHWVLLLHSWPLWPRLRRARVSRAGRRRHRGLGRLDGPLAGGALRQPFCRTLPAPRKRMAREELALAVGQVRSEICQHAAGGVSGAEIHMRFTTQRIGTDTHSDHTHHHPRPNTTQVASLPTWRRLPWSLSCHRRSTGHRRCGQRPAHRPP